MTESRSAAVSVREAAATPVASNYRALSEILAARAQGAVLGVDGAGRIVLSNAAAKALIGVDPLRGRRLVELFHADPVQSEELARALEGESRALTVKLASRSVTLTILPCRREHDGGGAIVLLDTGSPYESEEDATQRLAALGRLSAGVAHEIRNPLAGIGTNAQVLRRRFESGDARLRFVDFILEEVQRLDKIIEDLLRFARPPEPRLVEHDLTKTIERVLMMAGARIDAKGVQVDVEIEDACPKAFVDPDQLAQVLLNLVLNAVQAIHDEGRVSIRLRAIDDQEAPGRGERARSRRGSGRPGPVRQLALEVEDTGIGIDPLDLPKIFEPFFTTRPSGTGLGLSTSQVLIRQQGGLLRVDSKLGRGTKVTILIPVEKRRAAF